jgi:hypothetical protein
VADSATKIIVRQAPDQIARAVDHARLAGPQAQVIEQLSRGRALCKVGCQTTLVQHIIGPSDDALCNSDSRMLGSTNT